MRFMYNNSLIPNERLVMIFLNIHGHEKRSENKMFGNVLIIDFALFPFKTL